jgi:hypothetical protein
MVHGIAEDGIPFPDQRRDDSHVGLIPAVEEESPRAPFESRQAGLQILVQARVTRQ